jgi:hypothetical protein
VTVEQITEKQAMANIKYEAAKAIRLILDQAQSDYGAEWEDDGVEGEILDLVGGEG